MKIILATHNHHKTIEFKEMFKKINIEIVSLEDLNDFDEVEEGLISFKENAYLKAKYFYNKYHLPVISDDSGLVVEALNGEPGVLSSRYAGNDATDISNVNKLLDKMKNIKNRKAYFICVICYIDERNSDHYFEGRLFGEIGYSRTGKNGFGYDPIFIIDNKKSLATLSSEEKNSISHRYNALTRFFDYMNNLKDFL